MFAVCLLFADCQVLFAVGCLSFFVVNSSLCVVVSVLWVARCSLFGVRCVLFVACQCFVACFDVRCPLLFVVVCCLLPRVGTCLLCVA